MTRHFKATTVLVVEDNQPLQKAIRSLLFAFGIGRVDIASDGGTGFKSFCRHNPDIILTDWAMEPMDGLSLTRLVRTDPSSPNPLVPIIIMTAFGLNRRMLEARDAGANEFPVKPFRGSALRNRIANALERPRPFVRSDNFFGPDRRRQRTAIYAGLRRRKRDASWPESHFAMLGHAPPL
jgi:two-component system, chemotaxis family, chemotaxis protein CheY